MMPSLEGRLILVASPSLKVRQWLTPAFLALAKERETQADLRPAAAGKSRLYCSGYISGDPRA